jgi:beta-glucosidase
MARRFPQGFLWGTATAAHQVEGQNDNNQWWDWEQQPGRIWHGDRSGDACDWWRDPTPDLDRAVALGQNALRISLEWSRIEPREGEFDAEAIEYYRKLLIAMLERGLRPMVTLHHFTNPRWLEQRGAWLHPDTPALFGRFVDFVVEQLSPYCMFWCTINEPLVYATQSYVFGNWPPGQQSIPAAFKVVAAMLQGHVAASQAIRKHNPAAHIGIVHNLRLFDAARPCVQDMLVAYVQDFLFNQVVLHALQTDRFPFPLSLFLPPIEGLRESSTFFGLNYYTRDFVRFNWRKPLEMFGERFSHPDRPQSDIGFEGVSYGEIYPQGLYRALRRVARLGLPIYVTETGLPDAQDTQRPQFLLDHLGAIHQAISDGLDVRGVFFWTLVDNFEWAEGWGLRFGFYHLDPETKARSLRRSAGLFAALARANALPDLPSD